MDLNSAYLFSSILANIATVLWISYLARKELNSQNLKKKRRHQRRKHKNKK